MPLALPSGIDASVLRIGIVRTMWNESLVGPLTSGCRDGLRKAGVKEDRIIEISVPGSFELPYAVKVLAQTGKIAKALL